MRGLIEILMETFPDFLRSCPHRACRSSGFRHRRSGVVFSECNLLPSRRKVASFPRSHLALSWHALVHFLRPQYPSAHRSQGRAHTTANRGLGAAGAVPEPRFRHSPVPAEARDSIFKRNLPGRDMQNSEKQPRPAAHGEAAVGDALQRYQALNDDLKTILRLRALAFFPVSKPGFRKIVTSVPRRVHGSPGSLTSARIEELSQVLLAKGLLSQDHTCPPDLALPIALDAAADKHGQRLVQACGLRVINPDERYIWSREDHMHVFSDCLRRMRIAVFANDPRALEEARKQLEAARQSAERSRRYFLREEMPIPERAWQGVDGRLPSGLPAGIRGYSTPCWVPSWTPYWGNAGAHRRCGSFSTKPAFGPNAPSRRRHSGSCGTGSFSRASGRGRFQPQRNRTTQSLA